MAPSFFLKDIPSTRDLKETARRYHGRGAGPAEAYLMLLRVASDILEATDADLARHGASQGRLCVLLSLDRSPGKALSPWELAEKTGVSRATITGLLDRLERAGFVRRERSTEDRRSLKVKLLSRGEYFLGSLMPQRFKKIEGLMASLKPSECRALIRLLSRVANGIPGFRGRKAGS